jgi:arylsulfatase A-like enzyme
MLNYAKHQTRAKKRFFISALAYDTHVPYRYHEGITDRYFSGPFAGPIGKRASGHFLVKIAAGKVPMNDSRWAQLKALYNGEVEYMDRCFGQLLDGLEKLGQLDRTAIVFTSDHGEGFGEHGRVGHAYGLQAELVDVPLVILAPGLHDGALKIRTASSHLDLVPTVLDLLRVEPDPLIQGRSLIPLIQRQGSWTPRVVPMEYGKAYGLRSWRFRYRVGYHGEESLFDLKKDRLEQVDIKNKHPLVLRYFRDLAGLHLAFRSDWRMSTWGTLNRHGQGFLEHVGIR